MDELACVHALDGHEVLCSLLVSVCVSESDLGEWGASSGIVNDVLDNTLDVPLSLNVIESPESGWGNSVLAARLENKTTTVSLGCTNKESVTVRAMAGRMECPIAETYL